MTLALRTIAPAWSRKTYLQPLLPAQAPSVPEPEQYTRILAHPMILPCHYTVLLQPSLETEHASGLALTAHQRVLIALE
jgi:hypothetical protein